VSKEHAYPRELAAFVVEHWEADDPELKPGEVSYHIYETLPNLPTLERLLSACYQASLMREEERPVSFRLILAAPGLFPPEGGPPSGLQRMEFARRRPFDEDELRRLSPAADYHRSLIGVELDRDRSLRIWGLLQSGPRWVRRTQGGREASPPMPPVPVVHVAAPGRLSVHRGDVRVAGLEGGRLRGSSMDVFASKWLPEGFAAVRAELAALHEEARRRAEEPWAPLDVDLTRMIGQHVVRRVLAVLREAHHGGTVMFVPPELTGEFSGENRYVTFKYRFAEGEPRRRFRTLIVDIMNRLAEVHGKGEESSYPREVGWQEYRKTDDVRIAELDEAIFEVAHLMAALAAVDGAVVMTKRFEILGFGAEISGELPAVKTVFRALDLEGERVAEESTDGVGTRHRSAYRLCNALPEAVAVVISQDGSVRFVTRKGKSVRYWDQA
jgi:hypothetical protein